MIPPPRKKKLSCRGVLLFIMMTYDNNTDKICMFVVRCNDPHQNLVHSEASEDTF